jgi:hypothetical protein
MIKFKKFIYESELASKKFKDYLSFLAEDNISLSQAPKSVNWGTVKAGFDQAKDPTKRSQLGKQGRKMRPELLGDAGSNPKLAKEAEVIPEFKTKGLSLSPSDESGRINTCSCATAECRAACLNKSGHGAFDPTQEARLRKTDFMLDNPGHFMGMLHDEIRAHERSSAKQGKRAAVRLNVVSDIPYEHLHPEIFTENPNVQFYDYTKIAKRVLNSDGTARQLPANYHLTLSSTGIHKGSNWSDARQHLNNGGVVAMVFAIPAGRAGKPGAPLPTHVVDQESGKRYRVIDGDIHDHRHLDHKYNDAQPGEGLIAGLRLKRVEQKDWQHVLSKAGDFAVKVPAGQTEVVVPDHSKTQK